MKAGKTQAADTGAAHNRPPQRRLWSIAWLRRSLIGFAGVIVIVGVLEAIEWPFLRGPLESMLRHGLKREASIGADFGIRFIGPLRLRTDFLVVGAAPNGPTLAGAAPDLLRAADLRLTLPYSTLFALVHAKSENAASAGEPAERPYITQLEVSRLDATLLRDADGRANWRFDSEKKDTAPLVLPEFGRLVAAAGVIRVDDALSRTKLVAELRSDETSATSASSGLEVSALGTYREQKLSAKLHASGLLPLAGSTANTAPVPIRLDARVGGAELQFNGTASDALKLGGLDGEFRLAGPSLAAVGDAVGVTLPTTAAFVMRGKARKEGAVWSAVIGELSVGSSRLHGNFRYDPTLAVPKLSGELGGAHLALPDLGPAFGAPPRPPGGGKRPVKRSTDAPADAAGRRVLPQREFDLPSLAAMDADVTIALTELDLGTSALEKLAPLQAHLILTDQTLTVKDVVARTAQGDVRGLLAVDAREKTPRWKADLRFSGVQLERFVKARDRADRSAGSGYLSGYLSGSLGGHAQVRGSGRSTAQVLATLEGEAQLWVRNGAISHFIVELAGLDVAQALGMLVRGDDRLPMRCAVAGLKINRGAIKPEVALIETSDSTLAIDGGISLADERLALVFKALPKDRSPLALRSPVYVEGPFSDPHVRLDSASLGMRIAAAAALAALTPLAGLLALVDLGEPEKQVCAQALQDLQRVAPVPKSALRQR